MSETAFAPGETVGAAELARAGLLLLGEQAVIDATSVFVPADAEGAIRRIEIGAGVRLGAYAVICGGVCIGENAQVEEHAIVGKPEKGYAVGHLYPGAGTRTQISPGVVVRAGAVIYAGVQGRGQHGDRPPYFAAVIRHRGTGHPTRSYPHRRAGGPYR